MNNLTIYNSIRTELNKDQLDSLFGVTEYNNLAPIVNQEYLLKQIGLPEDYAPGQDITIHPRFQQIQLITENTRHLMVGMEGDSAVLPIDSNGYATLPNNYFYPSSLLFREYKSGKWKYRKVEVLSDASFKDRLSNAANPFSTRFPGCRFIGGRLAFEPKGLIMVDFVYLRKPIAPVIVFELNEEDDLEYDAEASTEWDWPDHCMPEIMSLMLTRASNITRDSYTKQSAEKKIQSGR